MPRTLSTDAESRIIDAVKRAVHHVDDGGLTPDAAIEKVAREERWGADMVRLAGHAYNTGRQSAQREVGAGILDKFATFALCDPQAVIAAIYPAKVKTAADAQLAGVSKGYASGPAWVGRRELAAKRAALHIHGTKEAAAKSSTTVAADRPKTAQEVYDEHRRLKRASAHARADASAAHDRTLAAMGALADYFKKSAMDRLLFAPAEMGVTTYFGKAGTALMDWVYARNRMTEPRYQPGVKLAGAYYPVVDYAVAPWSLVKVAVDCAAETNQKLAAAEVADVELQIHAKSELNRLTDVRVEKRSWDLVHGNRTFVHHLEHNAAAFVPAIRRQEKQAAAPVVAPQAKPEPWSLLKAAIGPGGAAVMGATTKDMLERAFGHEDTSNRVSDISLKLEDPAHESELQRIKTQAMLAGLMDDDVIGSHDPERVMQSFNEISQMAPRTAQQPVAIRALLRRHLQSNVEPFESKEITDIEKGIKDTRNPVPEIPASRPPAAAGGAMKKANPIHLIPEAEHELSIL